MTDAQIIASAITVLAVLSGSVFNNVRTGDVNTKLETIISMIGRLDTRLTNLEGRIH